MPAKGAQATEFVFSLTAEVCLHDHARPTLSSRNRYSWGTEKPVSGFVLILPVAPRVGAFARMLKKPTHGERLEWICIVAVRMSRVLQPR